MTIKELNTILSATINEIHNANGDGDKFGATLARADAEAKVARQYLKGAEIILRADKMSGRVDRINGIIG